MTFKGICLGDIVLTRKNRSIFEGEVTMISHCGINIKHETGVAFYKWCNVIEIKSAIEKQLKDYERVLKFYAQGDKAEQILVKYKGETK